MEILINMFNSTIAIDKLYLEYQIQLNAKDYKQFNQ